MRRISNSLAGLRACSLLVGVFVFAVSAEATTPLPFEADFEASDFTQGILVSDPDWDFDSAELTVEVTDADSASNDQSLLLTGRENFSLYPTDELPGQVRWVDFYVKPVFVEEPTDGSELEVTIEGLQSAVATFIQSDTSSRVYMIDGDGAGGGVWVSVDATAGWIRLTYRMDYANQKWDLFVNGKLSAIDLGFLDNDAALLNAFALRGDSDLPTGFDGFDAGDESQLFTDIDNDGINDAYDLNTAVNDRDADPDGDSLTNIEEFMHGTAMLARDPDGDYLSDLMEVKWKRDPNVSDLDLFHLNGDVWETGFEPEEGYVAGALDQQLGWSANSVDVTDNENAYAIHSEDTEVFAEHYFGTDPVDMIWFSFDAKLYAGELPDPATLEGRTAAVFVFSDTSTLNILDADSEQWLPHTVDADPALWNQYAVFLNYQTKHWDLYLNGVQVAGDMKFRDPELQALSKFKAAMQKTANSTAAAYMDNLKLYAGNDYDGDGLGDAWERAFGFSPASDDTDGNTTLDADENTDGDSLTALEEYQQGHLPTVADADVDYYVDQSLGDDALYNGQSAFPGAPTIVHGPKHTISDAIATADDSNVIFLQSGTYNETVLSLNGKNLTLRLNGPVTIR